MATILSRSLIVACLMAVAAAAAVKEEAAAGHHKKHHHHHHRDNDDYAPTGYGNAYPQHSSYPQFIPPALRDRYVCDLDASVLLVLGARRHGYNKAVRVRCSEIVNDADSCNVCCQHTARRDPNMPNSEIHSFMVVAEAYDRKKGKYDDDDDEDKDDEDEESKMRRKRSINTKDDPADAKPVIAEQSPWTPDPWHTNLKCICCAPRRDQYYYGQAPAADPTAAAPVPYGQPTAWAPPTPVPFSSDTGNNGWSSNGAAAPPVPTQSWALPTAAAPAQQGWRSEPAASATQGVWNSAPAAALTADWAVQPTTSTAPPAQQQPVQQQYAPM